MAENIPTKYNAPALDKGLDILELLSQEGIPLSQAEIAQGINKTPSEIYRMLVCLEERKYLIRGANAGKYRLSLKMYSLSHRHTPFDELKRVAYYPMQSLSEKIKESCHLSVMNNDKLLIIGQMRSPSAVSLSIEEGTHFPISLTTSGKVLLSTFSKEKLTDILTRDKYYNTWNKTKQNEFLDSVEKAKKNGYFYSSSTLTSGVTDIAMPIGEKESELSAVLAISVFSSNLQEHQNLDFILDQLKKAQQEINQFICK
ncbi:IclR family transcriptional regulator [Lutibacter citreus]|uniref:IclR family transcriptional regulator n=1 Tax=Lutibacter citreus TaxID=2138210 RepID=UPI000DBE3B18|nr:IclR family transcriptional regulator [Lutibacter citreus]